jgi:hypothetical protein
LYVKKKDGLFKGLMDIPWSRLSEVMTGKGLNRKGKEKKEMKRPYHTFEIDI